MRPLLALLVCAVLAGCHGDPGGDPPSTTAGGSTPSTGGGAPPPAGTPLVAAVFTADNDLDGAHELHAIDTVGGVLSLSYGVGDGHHVESFALSPDERQVAFAVDNGADSGLYVAPVDENAPTRLSPPGALHVEEFAWAPDGSRIAYRAAASPAQLYLVRPDGTDHVNPTGGVGEVESRVRWSFDGSWIAFHWDREVPGQHEVYVVRPDGSDRRRITTTAADATAGRYVHYSWAPTANCIVFRTDLDVAGEPELYVVDVDAGAPPVRLSAQARPGSVDPDQWAWSPDGSALVYRLRDAADGLRALYMVSKQGGDARKISGDVSGSVLVFLWSPDGTRVAYRDRESLHVTDGAAPPVEVARSAGIGNFEWSPAGDALAYLAGGLIPKELWTVDVPAGAPALVGEDVMAFAWEPPSQLAQVSASLLVVLNTTAFGLTLPIAGVWNGQEVTRRTVLPENTSRAAIRVVDGRAYVDAQVFVGGNSFYHSLSATDVLALSVGMNAVIKPLARPFAAWEFEGFTQSLDTTIATLNGSFPVVWFVHRNAEARRMSLIEWNEVYRGQVAPNVYLSIGVVPAGSDLALDVKFNEVGFAAIAELSFAPAIVSVSFFSAVRRWIASGIVDPRDGTDVGRCSSEPRPRRGVVFFAPTLYLNSALNLPSNGSLDEEWEIVQVLDESTDALLVEADGVIGWVRKDEVFFDPCPAVIARDTSTSLTLPMQSPAPIEAGAGVTVVDERESEGTRYFAVYHYDRLFGSFLEWVPASDVLLKPDEKRTIDDTIFFETVALVDARGTIPAGDPVTVMDSRTLFDGQVVTLVSWFDSEAWIYRTGWVDGDALTR